MAYRPLQCTLIHENYPVREFRQLFNRMFDHDDGHIEPVAQIDAPR